MFHPDSSDLLTELEAQAVLRVSRTTLWRLRRTGGLPHFRIGGEIRYRRSDLDSWLEAHKANGPETAQAVRLDTCLDARECAWRDAILAQEWGFHEEPTNSLTHSLHPYPAKFPPPLPARLIEILSQPGDTILDPFCGSGTTLVEALRLGRDAVGFDVNPIGVLATRAKALPLSTGDRQTLLDLADTLYSDAEGAKSPQRVLGREELSCEPYDLPAIPNIGNWFEPVAIREIGIVLTRIERLTNGHARDVARASLSAILVQVSNQDSETRYTARPRGLIAGEVLERCARKLRETLRAHESWRNCEERNCRVEIGDARSLSPSMVGRVHAVVTSPPYANAFDYHLYHRHRMFWLGYDPGQVRSREIGSHLNHQRERDGIASYTSDMTSCLSAIADCTLPGTPIALVVGDSVFHGKVISNAHILIEAARALGFRCIALTNRAIHPVKRSMIGPARRARTEHIMLLVRGL